MLPPSHGLSDEVAKERLRCIRCVEAHFPNFEGDEIALLILGRIANMIRSGQEDPRPVGPDTMFAEDDD